MGGGMGLGGSGRVSMNAAGARRVRRDRATGIAGDFPVSVVCCGFGGVLWYAPGMEKSWSSGAKFTVAGAMPRSSSTTCKLVSSV